MATIFSSRVGYFLIDLIIWVTFGPFLIFPLFIFFFVLKSLVKLLIFVFRNDIVKPIDTFDLAVSRDSLEKKPIVDIGFVLRVRGNIGLDQLRTNFKKQFVPNEGLKEGDPFFHLTCTFECFLGYLCIKKVFLDLEKQITEEPEALQGDSQTYFSNWFHSPYKDESGPRWEMVLLKNSAKTESYVAFRMHHGLVDGYGMVLIVDRLCGTDSPYLVPPEPELTFTDKLPRILGSYWIKASNSNWPLMNVRDSRLVDKFFISWVTLDVNQMKAVRRKLKVPFSTILYALQTGALRRYLVETGREDEITENIPVLHTISKPNHPRTRLTNHWAFVKLHTPFKTSDPIERVRGTEKEVESWMASRLHKSAPLYFFGLLNLMPTRYCMLNLQNALSTYKASLSSMVRAPSQYYLFNLQCLNIYHTFCTKDLCPQTVLYTTTASHNNQIDITLSAAPDLVGDQNGANRMAQKHFKDELDNLIELCEFIE